MVEQLKNKIKIKNVKEAQGVFEEVGEKIKDIEGETKKFSEKVLDFIPEYLRKRIIPSIILSVLAIIVLYSSAVIFNLFLLTVAVLMAFEWISIAKSEDDETNRWRFLGLGYILLPTFSLMYLRGIPNGTDIILWLFLVVWGTDTAAMFVGKTFGGPKLAPTISPKKTWSGLAGGVVISMFIGLLCSVLFKEGALFFIILSAFLAVLEQVSDLLESKFKRHFNVKDSGNLIPGHGGIMDRLDGFTLTAPIIGLLVLFSNSIF